MKKTKNLLIVGLMVVGLFGCKDNVESSSEVVNTNPYVTTDKYYYEQNDTIKVFNFNCEEDYYVLVLPYGNDPINSTRHYRSKTNTEVDEFEVSLFETYGEHNVYLTDSDFITIYRTTIFINDGTSTDYGISKATLKDYNLSIETNQTKELTYKLYWCDDFNRLVDYTPIKTVVSNSQNFDIELNQNMFKPKNANKLEIAVTEGKSTSYYIDLNDEFDISESKFLYSFNVITDIHVNSTLLSDKYTNHFVNAFTDMKNNFANSSAIITVGDNTNTGVQAEYDALKTLVDKYSYGVEIKYSLGNHDYMYNTNFNDAIDLFKSNLNASNHYYSFEMNGSKFIMLGADTLKGTGEMFSEQINWLKNELQNTPSTQSVFLFMHQPLKDTVAGSLVSYNPNTQDAYGFGAARTELMSIFDQYSNLVVFSGHSHWCMDSYQSMLYNDNKASFINVAAVAYIVDNENNKIDGAEGLYIEVYEDYILVHGREFIEHSYISSMQIIIPKK